jgi:PAS domain S-box-containing protein
MKQYGIHFCFLNMDSHYAYTPHIWPSFLTVLLLIVLAVYSGRRRSVPGALPFAIASLFAALWAGGSMMEAAAVEVQTKIFWVKFQGAWILPVVTAITCFVLEYAWPGRWLTRRNVVLLSIPCLLALGVVLTNDLYHLGWLGFAYDGNVIPLRGPGHWMFLAYGYGLVIVNLIVLAWLFLRSPQQRWPVVIMMTGQIAGRTLYLLEAAQIIQSDMPPFAFEYLMYAIALFRFRMFNVVPVARATVIERMADGLLVLDAENHIADLNLMAQKLLGVARSHIVGREATQVLAAFPNLIELTHSPAAAQIEMTLNLDTAPRCYRVSSSRLADRRGSELGRVIVLHDITEVKQARERFLQQQRALATLQERERVARELHDSLGQVLGYVKMQAQAARGLLAQNQPSKADDYLAQLVAVAQDAHADVREYILGAGTGVLADADFLSALTQYLRRFGENYGIAAELNAPPELSAGAFEPMVEAQLLRIIQEALTNVRKHARARSVRIGLSVYDSRVEAIVQDDGAGFDPEVLETAEGQKFGLRFMRERAAEVGGSVEVHSAPGEGTQVVICVPLRKESP